MSTSQKHAEFVSEAMKDKPVEAIAGVGPHSAGPILREKGFEKAYHLLGQFLVLDKNPHVFDSWLQHEVMSMNPKHRGDCIECIREWCERNL